VRVLVLGAGKIGSGVAELLDSSGDYQVSVADREQASLARLAATPGIKPLQLDASAGDEAALCAAIEGHEAVINAGPFHINEIVAKAAVAAHAHYLDLSEDLASFRFVRKLAARSEKAMIPQCGLAPGFVSILARELASRFEAPESVQLRVGALPRYPSNALGYNLTWSTEGLINEYCKPGDAIVAGEKITTQPLEGLEHFVLDGVEYEAFNTSGGLGSLCESFAGKLRELDYRTIRYPGHRDAMKLLLEDLQLRNQRSLLQEILEQALPSTQQDVVLIKVSVRGRREGRLEQETWSNRITHQQVNGKPWSAIRLTTAAGVCAAMDLLAQGDLPGKGLVHQEEIDFGKFIENRFGRHFAKELR